MYLVVFTQVNLFCRFNSNKLDYLSYKKYINIIRSIIMTLMSACTAIYIRVIMLSVTYTPIALIVVSPPPPPPPSINTRVYRSKHYRSLRFNC